MKTICITGLDGCGKSTQAKMLSKVLSGSRIVSVWDIIKRPEFQDWSIYKQPPPVEQYVVKLDALSRTFFVFHAFNEAYQRAVNSDADWLIFDGYWFKYWAVEQAMGTPKTLVDFLSEQYIVPDFTYFIDLEIEEIINRKKHLSVYETGNHQNVLQSFKNIQTNAHQILLSLLPDNTLLLDGKQSPEQIHKLITTALKI